MKQEFKSRLLLVRSVFNQPLSALPKMQRGLGLATAIFVITVMALLAVLITQLIRSNAEATQTEINLLRSYFAAQSGVEYGLNRAYPPDGTVGLCPAVTNSATTFVPATITANGLNQCSMEIECAALIVSDATYYTITSKGTCGDVSRTVQIRAQ